METLKVFANADILWKKYLSKKNDGGAGLTFQPESGEGYIFFESLEQLRELKFPVLVIHHQDWDSSVVHGFRILNKSQIKKIKIDLKSRLDLIAEVENAHKK